MRSPDIITSSSFVEASSSEIENTKPAADLQITTLSLKTSSSFIQSSETVAIFSSNSALFETSFASSSTIQNVMTTLTATPSSDTPEHITGITSSTVSDSLSPLITTESATSAVLSSSSQTVMSTMTMITPLDTSEPITTEALLTAPKQLIYNSHDWKYTFNSILCCFIIIQSKCDVNCDNDNTA